MLFPLILGDTEKLGFYVSDREIIDLKTVVALQKSITKKFTLRFSLGASIALIHCAQNSVDKVMQFHRPAISIKLKTVLGKKHSFRL